MPPAPDHFQKRTFVRLPFTDQYLREGSGRRFREQLARAFQRPLYTASITGAGSNPPQNRTPDDGESGARPTRR